MGNRRILLWAAIALVSTRAPALRAQDVASCRQILDRLPNVDPAIAASSVVTRPDPQSCRFAPMRFIWSRYFGWAMDSLTIAGLQPDGRISPGQPFRIEAHAVRNSPSIGNALSAYISKVGAIPFDIIVDALSDPAARRFTLRQASMHGEVIGSVRLEFALTDIVMPDNPLDGPPQDFEKLGLESLSIRLDNHGFVERMVTPAAAAYVASNTPDADPEPLIEAKKHEIAIIIATMPALYGLPPETADALARFVSDFPHPSGSFQCSLAAAPPVHFPADMQPPGLSAIREFVTATHPTCSYTRS